MVKHAVAQQDRPVDVIGVHDWTLVGLAVASKRISVIDKAKPVGVGAVCQAEILTGERSGLLMRIAVTDSVSSCTNTLPGRYRNRDCDAKH
jgi:hypothetical protein